MMLLSSLVLLLPAFVCVRGEEPVPPTVALDGATFTGAIDGLTSKFLGIPYAQPPIGNLRFSRPVAADMYTGNHDASAFGPVCPQQIIPLPSSLPPDIDQQALFGLLGTFYDPSGSSPQSEDCLTVNVWKPSNAHPGSALPVLVWIHGGGFQDGSGSFLDGKTIVERAIHIGEPIIFVSLNYRLSGKFLHSLGFLTGQEAQDAGVGNLGYRDQRLALQWVQTYIQSFGGDHTKVVIWGQSAGALSVNAQLLTNNGNPSGLFRGAFMWNLDLLRLSATCRAPNSTTTTSSPIPGARTLKAAIDASPSFFSYQSLSLSWGPRTDGDFLPQSPVELVSQGIVADVPVILGTCDDEGTLFALPSLNITTTPEVVSYLGPHFFFNLPTSSLQNDLLDTHYPEDPAKGSPFHTGTQNAVTTQFKRLAAVVGDWVFEAPKRSFVEAVHGNQHTWTYLSKREKSLAVLGAAHVTDLYYSLGTQPTDMMDHLIHFVNYLNPNGAPASSSSSMQAHLNSTEQLTAQTTNTVTWPRYTSSTKAMLVYLDGTPKARVAHGFERKTQVGYLQGLMGSVWIP